jgi:hypothetical protein
LSSRLLNEAPRRKRAGYQSGLKTNLDYGGHAVSPKPPSAYFTPPQADGVLKNQNKLDAWNVSIYLIPTTTLTCKTLNFKWIWH